MSGATGSVIADRVWYHVPTDQLGYAIPKTIFGNPCFFFADHRDDETLNERFCNFVDDPRDPKSFKGEDFIDLGEL